MMPQCDFVETVPGKLWTCSVCGFEAQTDRLPAKVCSVTPVKKKKPSLARRAANLGRAALHAGLDGFTRATPEQVTERTAICQGCDRFDAANNSCNECGCQLAYKPLMRAWTCPLGKWPNLMG